LENVCVPAKWRLKVLILKQRSVSPWKPPFLAGASLSAGTPSAARAARMGLRPTPSCRQPFLMPRAIMRSRNARDQTGEARHCETNSGILRVEAGCGRNRSPVIRATIGPNEKGRQGCPGRTVMSDRHVVMARPCLRARWIGIWQGTHEGERVSMPRIIPCAAVPYNMAERDEARQISANLST
jgi:hypothetical protein